jgi:stage III sporulation protein AE
MKGVISITEGSVDDLKELLTVLLPCFTSINLLGGASISSVTEATSFSVVIAILEMILSGILTFPVVICTVVGIFEQVNPTLSDMKLSRSLKKFILTFITFTTTMMMTAIAFQGIISARADGLQTRTVKFAASSFIPLVGNAVGEALRTVSSGVQYLKASIGYASAVSVFLTVFPLICEVLAIKMILTVLAFFSNVTGTNEASGYFDICVGLIDIILAIIICVTLLSFLLVFTFAVIVIGG